MSTWMKDIDSYLAAGEAYGKTVQLFVRDITGHLDTKGVNDITCHISGTGFNQVCILVINHPLEEPPDHVAPRNYKGIKLLTITIDKDAWYVHDLKSSNIFEVIDGKGAISEDGQSELSLMITKGCLLSLWELARMYEEQHPESTAWVGI